MGGLRCLAHPFSPGSPLAAYHFPCLGNLYRTAPLAVSSDSVGELLEAKAGVEPYHGGFLLHYLDKFVYPDISATPLMVASVLVCAFNLGLYGRRMWIADRS